MNFFEVDPQQWTTKTYYDGDAGIKLETLLKKKLASLIPRKPDDRWIVGFDGVEVPKNGLNCDKTTQYMDRLVSNYPIRRITFIQLRDDANDGEYGKNQLLVLDPSNPNCFLAMDMWVATRIFTLGEFPP